MEIVTNNVPRHLIYKYELTEREQAEFDYLDATDELFRYRGELYPIADFCRIAPRRNAVGFEQGVDDDSPLLKWHGIATSSYGTATVIKYLPEDGAVVVGRATW